MEERIVSRQSVLHVFNGDCAADAWQKNAHSTDRFIVWRENYLEGPLPAPGTPREEFARIRAEFLHSCVPQYSVETLTNFQCRLEETLAAPDASGILMLWFDDCMFDIVMLSRILFLLEGTPAEVRLCCENRILGAETDFFRTPPEKFRKLEPETIRIYADSWRALTSGTAALTEFVQAPRVREEVALQRALERYLEDHPADGNPGLSEKKLLALIASGEHDFGAIFRKFNASETRPFMGDTMCERVLQTLADKGYLTQQPDKTWRLTEKRLM